MIIAHKLGRSSKNDFKLPLDLFGYLLRSFEFSQYLAVMDVGAFVGAFPEQIFSRKDEFSKIDIHCFDANKYNIDFIKGLSIANEIQLNHKALIADDCDEVTFSIPRTSYVDSTHKRSWGGRVIANSTTGNEDQIIVPATNISNYLSSNGISTPGLVKIDVQGGELDVVKGAGHQLRDIPLIHMECQLNHSRDIHFIEFMENNGFEVIFDEYQFGIKFDDENKLISLLEQLSIGIRRNHGPGCIFAYSTEKVTDLIAFLRNEGPKYFTYFQTDLMCINKKILPNWKSWLTSKQS